jgi:hypothetical protein
MKQLRYIDFDCSNCGNFETRFVYVDTDTGYPALGEDRGCGRMLTEDGGHLDQDGKPECKAGEPCTFEMTPREINGIPPPITIVKGNSDYNERERERLEKRQDDHWRRQGRDEAVDRERALFKKHGMEGTGGVR